MRGASRTAVNQARASFEEKAPETKELILKAISELDKAAGKGVIHKNAAARRKGRLMKKLSTFVPIEAAEVTTKASKKKK